MHGDGGEDAAQRREAMREDGGGVVRVERGRENCGLEEGQRRPGRKALMGVCEEFTVVLEVAAPQVEGDVWRARPAVRCRLRAQVKSILRTVDDG